MKLTENPFYILNVPTSAPRRRIIAAADELSFALDSETCTEAQNILLSPPKRLSAELDWFLGAVSDDIRSSIESGTQMSSDHLNGISKLNAELYNFQFVDQTDLFEIGFEIIRINELYETIDIDELTQEINTSRETAKLSTVQEHEVNIEFNKKRERILQVLTEKLEALSQNEYVELVTMLAEKCMSSDYGDGAVIGDVISQYEVRMQALIDSLSSEIHESIDKIISAVHSSSYKPSDNGNLAKVKQIVEQVKTWDKYAQPLQLKSQASGMPHENSERLGRKIRDLALTLHNEASESKTALVLVEEMQPVFAEIEALSDLFENDADTLKELIENDAQAKVVVNEIKSVQEEAERVKIYSSDPAIDNLLKRVRELDQKLKNIGLDSETLTNVRLNLCFMTRDVAITINNKKDQAASALKICKFLREEFAGLSEAQLKLNDDIRTLAMNKAMKDQQQARQEAQDKARLIMWAIFGGIFAIVLLISALSGSGSSSSSSTANASTSSTTSSTTSSSNKATTPPASTSTESKFSTSSKAGDKVYVTIKSIFPAMGIYKEKTTYYTDFVCECTTTSGTTVWVYMTTSEYKKYFDSNASTSIYNNYADEIELSPSKKIHGTVKSANSIMSGLATDIGATLVIDFSSIG